ncbi:MAG: AI-2E family transporter [Anaerolineales bacterium]|nr:AI-2E family transporter [Anaerolineales bacterium]
MVLVSLIFWGWVLGPIGMVLSVPITATIKIILDAYAHSRWLAVLLGNAPE